MKLNELTQSPNFFEVLKQKYSSEKYFVHYGTKNIRIREDNQGLYTSPAGIYTYKASTIISENEKINMVAAQHEEPWFHVLQLTSSRVLDQDKTTDKNIQHILSVFSQEIGDTQYQRILHHYQLPKDTTIYDPRYFFNNLSNLVAIHLNMTVGRIARASLLSGFQRQLLLKAGYEVIIDGNGKNWLGYEDYEPDQALFLTLDSFKIVYSQPKPTFKIPIVVIDHRTGGTETFNVPVLDFSTISIALAIEKYIIIHFNEEDQQLYYTYRTGLYSPNRQINDISEKIKYKTTLGLKTALICDATLSITETQKLKAFAVLLKHQYGY